MLNTGSCPKVRQVGEPFPEQAKLSCVTMSTGKESEIVSALLTKTSVNDYEELCETDICDYKTAIIAMMIMYVKNLRRNLEGTKRIGKRVGSFKRKEFT